MRNNWVDMLFPRKIISRFEYKYILLYEINSSLIDEPNSSNHYYSDVGDEKSPEEENLTQMLIKLKHSKMAERNFLELFFFFCSDSDEYLQPSVKRFFFFIWILIFMGMNMRISATTLRFYSTGKN